MHDAAIRNDFSDADHDSGGKSTGQHNGNRSHMARRQGEEPEVKGAGNQHKGRS